MNNFVDILSRLIIATITFVAPMIVFCFSFFNKALMLKSEEDNNRKKEIAENAYERMGVPDANKIEVIKESNKQIEVSFRKKILNFFMNPKNQIIIIFSFLFFSIGSLMLSYLVKDNVWNMFNLKIWKFFIHFSFWSYVLAITFVFLFVKILISMKEKVDKNNG